MSASVSGSPNRTLYSSTLTPWGVNMKPVNKSPTKGKPSVGHRRIVSHPLLFNNNEERKRTVFSHAGDGLLQDRLDLGKHSRGSDRSGGVSAHSTGVRSEITVSDSLVVLSAGESSDGVSVRESKDGKFGSGEELFDHNL